MPCQSLYGNESNFLISPALHNDTEYHLRMKKTLNKLPLGKFVMQSKHVYEHVIHSLNMLEMHYL